METVRDRTILSELLAHRVLQEYPIENGKVSIFAMYGGHLGFQQKIESVNITQTVRDRVISTKFLARRVVQECPFEQGKISIFAT